MAVMDNGHSPRIPALGRRGYQFISSATRYLLRQPWRIVRRILRMFNLYITTTDIQNLAGKYFESGQFVLARQTLERVRRINLAHYSYMLGSLYLLDGREADAVPWLIQAGRQQSACLGPAEYFAITSVGAPYVLTEFDKKNDQVAWLRNAYNFTGQRALHVGEGQLRPAFHAKAMEKQRILRERAQPTPALAEFLKGKGIDFATMHVLPWEWTSQIGHLGMLEIMLRTRALGWWDGHAIVLAHKPKVANDTVLSLFANYPDVTVIDDAYVGGVFTDPIARELASLIHSHGMPYYAWKYPDGSVVPWHEAGAKAMWEWEEQGRGLPFRDLYDEHCGRDASTAQVADEAFREWGLSPSDWYVCVHIREPSYNRDETGLGQSNRDSDPANYEQAVRYITERGGWVIKLGAPTSPPLPEMPRVVDYARSKFKSERMDLHLIRHARFFIGTTSGLANIAVSFGLPTAQVNCLTTESQLWHSGVRFCLKPIYRSDGGVLSQDDITSTQSRWGLFTFDTMERYGLRAGENSPDEILETVKEVEALAEGREMNPTDDDRALIDEWRKCLPVPYQYGCSQPSIHFLRKHRGTFLRA